MESPDAIVVLAGGIKQDSNGQWVSTDLTEEDNKQGAPGGQLRVLATAILSNHYPRAMVIASGGKGFDVPAGTPEDRPLLSEILKNELLVAGVPEDRIELETASNTTYQSLQEVESKKGTLDVVSNRWHLPRVAAMLEMKFPTLRERVQLVAAEDVLIEADAGRWTSTIETEYAKAYMQERMQREQSGIIQIQEGTYHFT